MTDNIGDVWNRTVARLGARRALVEAATGREATFVQLSNGARAWSERHLAEKPMRGRMVVFALPNGVAWLEMFLAVVGAGAVAVPLDPGEPVAAVAEAARALGGAYWWDGRTLQATPRLRRFRDPEACLVKLTSGSTGRPRPLVFSLAQALADARQVTASMGITDGDLNYALIPFGHSYGLGNLSLPLIAMGVPVVCGTAGLPQAIAEDLLRWRPTVFPGVPALWSGLIRADVAPEALGSLRLCLSAGAPLTVDVAQAFAGRFGRKLHAFYGSSETGGIAYDRDGNATLAGAVGRELDGVTLALGPGGRLTVSSAAACTHGRRGNQDGRGVWAMPDRVERRSDGSLVLLGRRGAFVKLAGRRVSLGEIESRLRRLPDVRDVWVGVSDGTEPVLGAAVVSGHPPAQLRALLSADAAPWKVPRRLVVLSSLPLTARGKIDTRALRELVFERR